MMDKHYKISIIGSSKKDRLLSASRVKVKPLLKKVGYKLKFGRWVISGWRI